MAIYRMARRVRFQDIDAAGILFYAVAFEYFHDALMENYFARGVDLPAAVRGGAWAAPIRHCEARFVAPMRFGDPVVVVLERADLGKSSLTISYRVVAEGDESYVYCTGQTVSVFVARPAFTPCPIPEEIRAAFSGAATGEP